MGRLWFLILFSLCFFIPLGCTELLTITEDNWKQILDGEWMIEFYAPWCPACQSLASSWKSFADRAKDLDVKIAHVDITKNPALTGIFFVTSLPTIYHVKEGSFRIYKDQREVEEFYEYVSLKKYLKTDAIPWYYSPGSLHMKMFGFFIRFCVLIRDFHLWLVETQGFPAWASYIIMGVGTLASGMLLGLVLIFCCDCLCPPRPQAAGYLFGRRAPPPRPLITKENDSDPDDILDEGETDRSNSGSVPHEEETAETGDENSGTGLRQRSAHHES